MTESRWPEGWRWIGIRGRWHYFREATSLCHRWASYDRKPLVREQSPDMRGDWCQLCQRRRESELRRMAIPTNFGKVLSAAVTGGKD